MASSSVVLADVGFVVEVGEVRVGGIFEEVGELVFVGKGGR